MDIPERRRLAPHRGRHHVTACPYPFGAGRAVVSVGDNVTIGQCPAHRDGKGHRQAAAGGHRLARSLSKPGRIIPYNGCPGKVPWEKGPPSLKKRAMRLVMALTRFLRQLVNAW